MNILNYGGYEMLRYQNKGYTIEIQLPETCGHEGYSVECTYQYDKEREQYLLSMWLKRNDIDDKFKIDSQEIDTQFIRSTKEKIKLDICKLVEHASFIHFFDSYIERYEYTYKCFSRGNEIYETKRIKEK